MSMCVYLTPAGRFARSHCDRLHSPHSDKLREKEAEKGREERCTDYTSLNMSFIAIVLQPS